VDIYRAYHCEFGFYCKQGGPADLTLTVDLRAKVMRTVTLAESIYEDEQKGLSKAKIRGKWKHERAIATYDRKTYDITDVIFQSPNQLKVPGKNMSHTAYFAQQKKIKLKYPSDSVMIEAQGRKGKIYFPSELLCSLELSEDVRSKLPMIAGFSPNERVDAMREIKNFLVPGAQRTRGISGLMPALGVALRNPICPQAMVLSIGRLNCAGVNVSGRAGWAPKIHKAAYQVKPNRATNMKCVVFHHKTLNEQTCKAVYDVLVQQVNGYSSKYRLLSSVTFVATGKFKGAFILS